MANATKSSIAAFKEEVTEGTLIAPAAGDFIALREGFTVTNELETVTTDELKSGIGASAPINVGENPTASYPAYMKHSGVEGTEPEYGIVFESAMGDKTVNSTEYNTVASSTVSVVKVDSAEGANFEIGQGLLVKDGTNGYSIRNVESISTDDLTVNFNLDNAPGTGVDLGKAVFYKPASSGHPTFTTHHHQNTSSSAFYQAISGCRTTSLGMEFPTRDLASFTAEIEGLSYFFDPITIDATNDDFSVVDDGGTVTGSITQKTYATPIALASEVQTKILAAVTASGGDDFTCSYDSTTGKYTCATTTGTVLELNADVANSVFTQIGFGTSALTGATTYTAASAIAFDPAVTPAYDSSDPVVVRNSELLIGDATDNTCRKAINSSFTIATPKTQVKSICAENGISETIILSREATLTSTIVLDQYEAHLLDKALNNTTTPIMLNTGVKTSAGNWTAGTCINVYMKNAKIKTTVTEEEGYYTFTVEATAFINSSTDKDIYINFL